MDLAYLALVVLLFVLTFGLAGMCGKLGGGKDPLRK